MVMQGIQPSLIICGAPGVGKTYKVKKQLKAGGYELGKNLWTEDIMAITVNLRYTEVG